MKRCRSAKGVELLVVERSTRHDGQSFFEYEYRCAEYDSKP